MAFFNFCESRIISNFKIMYNDHTWEFTLDYSLPMVQLNRFWIEWLKPTYRNFSQRKTSPQGNFFLNVVVFERKVSSKIFSHYILCTFKPKARKSKYPGFRDAKSSLLSSLPLKERWYEVKSPPTERAILDLNVLNLQNVSYF